MITRLRIQNFKSIVDLSLEIGRINVFIGENGSGKTNILEAVAMAGAGVQKRVQVHELYERGVRIARPAMMRSGFVGVSTQGPIQVNARVQSRDEESGYYELPVELHPLAPDSIDTAWFDEGLTSDVLRDIAAWMSEQVSSTRGSSPTSGQIVTTDHDVLLSSALLGARQFQQLDHRLESRVALLRDFCIYNPTFLALRGVEVSSRLQPIGLHGENLDVLLAGFSDEQLRELSEAADIIPWFQELFLDVEDRLKFQGHKLGRSVSRLYFRDRLMAADGDSNVFSAENANEGILHLLFYMALFTSPKTPPFFGIDNIDTGLNPQLCRDLMVALARLAKRNDKQALITTHNPAILDGLDLHDPDQRLFVVYRNDDGHTACKRIELKPDAGDGRQYKLSELWMRGHLGGLPRNF